jgi:predicted nucleic acid-binding protein
MDADQLRPVQPFKTPWTVGRMAADTCVWLALFDPSRAEHAATESLLGYRREARVEIVKTDTVDTERTEGVLDAIAIERILETAGIVELLGPAVWDHSRLDHSVWAADEDGKRIDDVFAVLFPGSDRHGSDRTSRHKIRDAMHVATAIRYGCDAFVTTDDDLLRKAAQVQALWNIEML